MKPRSLAGFASWLLVLVLAVACAPATSTPPPGHITIDDEVGGDASALPAGEVVLDDEVGGHAVGAVRSTEYGLCLRVEGMYKDAQGCIGPDLEGARFWFAEEVAPGQWVVLLATVPEQDPYWTLSRIEATTTDGARLAADAIADGALVFLHVEGDLDHTYVWNRDGTLVQETWPPYWGQG